MNRIKQLLSVIVLTFAALGAFAQTYTPNGANTAYTILTSGTQWTVPACVSQFTVYCVGGGGAGGGGENCNSSHTGGGGGGGGGFASKTFTSGFTAGTTVYPYTIGAGGTKGGSSGDWDQNGSAGGDTWFSSNSVVKAAGGGGGKNLDINSNITCSGIGGNGYTGAGGAGGSANIGDVTSNGGNGGSTTSLGGGGAQGGGAGGGTGSSAPNNNYSNCNGGVSTISVPGIAATAFVGGCPRTTTSSTDDASFWTNGGTYGGGGGGGTATSSATSPGVNGKPGVIVIQVTYSSPPVPTIVAVAATCSANGSSSISNYDATVTYTFTPTGPTVGAGGVISGMTLGTSYTVVASNGSCTSTASAAFQNDAQLSPPTAVTASNGSPYCVDGMIALSATSTGGTIYTWSGPNSYTGTGANPTAFSASTFGAGVYTFTVSASNGSCAATATTDVTISSSTPPAITSATADNSTPCPNGTVNFTGAATGATSYSWTNPSGTSISNTTTATEANISAGGNYTFIATNQCNSVSQEVPITVPNITISGTTSYCAGATGATLTANGGSSYSWSSGETTATITAPSGTYTVTDVPTTCSATAAVTMVATPTVTISATPNAAVCAGTSVILAASGATTYLWSSGQSTANITVAPTTTTTYTVTGTAACSATASYVVTVNPVPTVSINALPNTAICEGTQVTLSGNGADTYSWSGGISDGTAFTPAVGTTVYTLTGTSAGCSATASFSSVVNSNPTASATARNITCNNDNDGWVAVVPSGGSGSYTYNWSPNVTTASFAQNLGEGTYNITVLDGNNCSASVSATVVNPPLLDVSFDNDSAKCNGKNNGLINAAATGGVAPYHFSIINRENNGSGVFSGVGAGTYTVSVVDGSNCIKTYTTVVYEPAPMTISVNPNPVEMELGETIEVSAVTNVANAVFTWFSTNEAAVSCATCATTTLLTDRSTVYTVAAAIDDNACTVATTVPVTVKPNYNVFIPNVFSPNGDNNNDEYEIFGNKKALKYLNFKVFNRWGEMVYQTYDVDFRWNGNYRDAKLDPGTYVYYLETTFIDGYHSSNSGTVTIVK